MRRSDILLYMMSIANGVPLLASHLLKVPFIVGQEFADILPENYYAFRKGDYGPMCKDIFSDMDELKANGYVAIGESEPGGYREYYGTIRIREYSFSHMPDELLSYIQSTVLWAMTVSFTTLIREVRRAYLHHPAYA